MQKPNVFIIGAAKCGTTSLATYLGQHRQIFMCDPKEPFFFNTDMSWRGVPSEQHYLSLFEEATESHIAIGEASTSYLYSDIAVPNILAFCPDAKFIVMVRNPVDMAYALYSELVWNGQEEFADFEEAWSAQDRRQCGEDIPRSCREPRWLQYWQACALGTQLRRLVSNVPRTSVKIVVFEEFKSQTQGVYRDVLNFLGVPDDGRRFFEIYNASKRPRLRTITLGLRHLASLKEWSETVLGTKTGLGILKTIDRLNTVPYDRPPMPLHFRARLIEEFRDEIMEMSALLERDLSAWLMARSVSEEKVA